MDAIVTFVRLTLLRPIERFLAQCISISTQPSAFVRERVHLGDTTNFVRAGGFFISSISTAFLVEVATLYLLRVGNLNELYYWLFVLLTIIPFVLICFLLVRFAAPLSFRDVLHLSFYPIGAGVFAGAAFGLVTAAVVALLVGTGYIMQIQHDLANWSDAKEVLWGMQQELRKCQEEHTILYRVLLGSQDAYHNLKFPLSSIGLLRPLIAVLYFIVAARVFMVAVKRRRWVVFTLVLLAALFAVGTHFVTLGAAKQWAAENSGCEVDQRRFDALVEPEEFVQRLAADVDKKVKAGAKDDDLWDMSVRAEGRTVICEFRLKEPINMEAFPAFLNNDQKDALQTYCSFAGGELLRKAKGTMTHTFYDLNGERIGTFSIGSADCQKW